MNNVQDTSVESYIENERTGIATAVGARILDHVRKNGPISRRTIAEDLGLDTATVSGLVRPMIVCKVLYQGDKMPDPKTGRSAYTVEIKPKQKELEL